MVSTSTRLTYDDYLRLPDDGKRHEIIDGEHYVTPSPNTRHQAISLRLEALLFTFVDTHKLGQVFDAPYDVLLSRHDIVEPDILFISTQRLEIITEKNVQGAPDLVIEILSESTRRRDERLKHSRYEQLGVAEYWIVDPETELIKIYRRKQNTLSLVTEVRDQQPLTTPLLPGFEVPAAAIFAS